MTLLDRYDAEMRIAPVVPSGMTLSRTGGVVRLTGPYNLISYADLTEDDADAAIAGEVGFFRRLGEAVEWKVHAHDRPTDLSARLERAGFVSDPSETLVVFDLAGVASLGGEVPGVSVRQVKDPADFLAAVEAAFGEPFHSGEEALRAGVADGTVALHVAYVDGRPVGAGRLEMSPQRSFAGLYTGGVAPEHRRRGLYRALVRARAEQAAQAGYRYLISEALETSRPILARLGFTPMTTVQGWVFEP